MKNNTLSALGLLQACLNRSSEANLLRLHTKSARGPISSSSILGVFVFDFFKSILKTYESIHDNSKLKLYLLLNIHTIAIFIFI